MKECNMKEPEESSTEADKQFDDYEDYLNPPDDEPEVLNRFGRSSHSDIKDCNYGIRA
ncbi:MAG: hypothetical protein K5770_08060 [Lachnospiraceae bacterium]|nr:hypothetical protein [Lachnospiraceae bacterium]